MDIRTDLEGPIHPGDQVHFALQGLQRLHRGRQSIQGLDLENRILITQ